jgi:hypothetical protein
VSLLFGVAPQSPYSMYSMRFPDPLITFRAKYVLPALQFD